MDEIAGETLSSDVEWVSLPAAEYDALVAENARRRAALEEIAALVEKEPDEERRRYWHQMMSPEEYDFERGLWCAVKIARAELAKGQGE